jgi:hypothetical protein
MGLQVYGLGGGLYGEGVSEFLQHGGRAVAIPASRRRLVVAAAAD